MRRLIVILLVIALAVSLGILLRFNHGNVAVFWPPYRLDVSVNFAMLFLLAGFALGYFVIRTLNTTLRLPTVVREYRAGRARDLGVQALADGVVAFYEGRFGRAERLAEKARQVTELDAAACLLASRAAHRMREPARRDQWLHALSDEGKHQLALQMTRAEILLDDRQTQEALEAIELAQQAGGRHVQQLRLALRAYEQAENWSAMLKVLRQIERSRAMPEEVIQGLSARAWRGRIKEAQGSPERLKVIIKEAGSSLNRPELIDASVDALIHAGEHLQAARLIERKMGEQYRPGLVLRYAELNEPPARERLRLAEAWLGAQGEEPALLEALGKLCAKESLWGKAEDFLVRAQKKDAGAGALLALATVYEKIGRPFDAAQLYKTVATEKRA
jgi:HemY protein